MQDASPESSVPGPSPAPANNFAIAVVVSGVTAILLGVLAVSYKYFAYTEPLMPRLIAGSIGWGAVFFGIAMTLFGSLVLVIKRSNATARRPGKS